MNDFDFDAAENEFEGVELPELPKTDLGPAEQHIVKQLENGFEMLEQGLRHALGHVESFRNEIDFEEVIRDPEKAESLCGFTNVVEGMPQSLALIIVAMMAARGEFLTGNDDLADAS